MQVSRIEIFGFKSFMEKLVLPLNSGITGIVGPNGCGKSNVVDAVRWVLGETRAKNLRGGVLEDVIFNGTDKLRPLGLAEVTMTVKAEGKDFFEDLTSPELEAERIANGEDLDEELDEEIVEEEVLEVEELSELNEDGQPILRVVDSEYLEEEKEEEKKEEEEKKLNQNKTSASTSLLQKYSWLKSASEIQVTRRLYRSGESEFFINKVPCRLKDMRDFFRAVGLSSKGFTIVAQGEISQIITSKPEQRRKVMEEAAGVQGFRDKINSAQARLRETADNLDRINDIVGEVSRQVGTLKRQANKAENREDLKEEIRSLDEDVYKHKLYNLTSQKEQNDNLYNSSKEQEYELEKSFQEQKSVESELRSSLMEIDIEGDDLRSQIDNIRDEINTRISSRSGRTTRLSELGALISAKTNDVDSLMEKTKTLQERIEVATEEVESYSKQKQEFEAKLKSLEEEQSVCLESVTKNVEDLRSELKVQEKEMQVAREDYVSSKTELKSLESQVQSASAREQLRELSDSINDENIKPLLDNITVSGEYVGALEAVLAEKAAFLLCENPYDLAKTVLSSENRGTIGAIRANQERYASNENTSLELLSSKIEITSQFENAVKNLLFNVYVVNELSDATDYFNDNKNSQVTIVTKAGEILTSGTVYIHSHDSGLVQIKNKIVSLTEECVLKERRLEELTSQRESLYNNLQEADRKYSEVLSESQKYQAEVRELGNELGLICGKFDSAKNIADHLTNDFQGSNEEVERFKSEIASFNSEIMDIKSEIDSDDTAQDDTLKEELSVLEVQYQEIEKRKRESRESLNVAIVALDKVREELDTFRQNVSESSLDRQRVDIEYSNLKEKIEEEYGEDFFQLCQNNICDNSRLEEDVYSSSCETLRKLKARIVREGEIDPESVERYREEDARLQDLLTQREDLNSASVSINETLGRLIETSEQRFEETFNKVAENFSVLIPKLFGGGVGRLELSDPQNPLDSGLEIVARPPGKKLKSIELMSGGEKALCATALIVSMFLVRPSPLCILDEVDAPLDDANLARFLGVVKEMSSTTQFLLITHNKQSMAVADNLVGITMEKPGATKALSVSLQEAFSHVA